MQTEQLKKKQLKGGAMRKAKQEIAAKKPLNEQSIFLKKMLKKC